MQLSEYQKAYDEAVEADADRSRKLRHAVNAVNEARGKLRDAEIELSALEANSPNSATRAVLDKIFFDQTKTKGAKDERDADPGE